MYIIIVPTREFNYINQIAFRLKFKQTLRVMTDY